MNNMNFSRNKFINTEPARIANKVVTPNKDGGVVSINQIVSNMQNLRRGDVKITSNFEDDIPVVERKEVPDSKKEENKSIEVEKMRLQALRNVGKKCQ